MSQDSAGPAVALFVSPHFDDVALSCGGTVAVEGQEGRVLVVTVFAGDPPAELNAFAEFQHRRWGREQDTVGERRREDAAAMAALGADYERLDFPDAIYRGSLYLSDEDLFGPVKPGDQSVTAAITTQLLNLAAAARPRRVYLPLGVGNHVDHQICIAAGLVLTERGWPVRLYEDFPYAATPGAVEERVRHFDRPLTSSRTFVGDAIERRLAAIRCYSSQLATIFRHHGDPEAVVRAYASRVGDGAYAERFWEMPS